MIYYITTYMETKKDTPAVYTAGPLIKHDISNILDITEEMVINDVKREIIDNRILDKIHNNHKFRSKTFFTTVDYIPSLDLDDNNNLLSVIRYRYDHSTNTITRHKCLSGSNYYRQELSDLNNTQYIYPIGSNVKLGYNEYGVKEAVIIENNVGCLNEDGYSNSYEAQPDGWGKNNVIEVHFKDIISSDKPAEKYIKNKDK